jgi:hypothetical protein
VNTLRSLMSATLLALALAAPSVQAADENPWKFEFHGFVTGSMYYQDQAFGGTHQGQGLLYSAPSPTNSAPCVVAGGFACAAGTATKSASLVSGDIRNSRFAFWMSGPKVFGDAQPRAVLEFDFFGLYGAGAFASEQNIPRIRAAFVELKSGNLTVQVGQQNQLVAVQGTDTLSHHANPVTYGAGTIAWRTPGVRVLYLIPLDGMKLELGIEAVKNKWSNEAVNAVNTQPTTPAAIGLGEASGMPMFQGRALLTGKAGNVSYMAYLVGIYQSLDLNGFGDGVAVPAFWGAGKTSASGSTFEVGGKVGYAPVSLAGQYYSGKLTGNMLGSLLQFGDVKDSGYWVQLAGNFTKELSLSLMYGAATPNKADIRRVGGNLARLANNVMGGMLKYQDGGYAVGVEYYKNTTTWSTTATTQIDTNATQMIATAGYFF